MGLGSIIGAGLDIFTGGIPIFSAIGSGLDSASGQRQANQQNIDLSREQMAFQERMSNTSYQRATQSMKDAGLNPMLAYSQGGASTPMGSMPQVQNAVAPGISSALQATNVTAALQSILQSKAQTDLLAANADQVRSQTIEQELNSALAASEIELRKARTGESAWSANKLRLEGPGAGIDTESKRARFQEMDKAGGFATEVRKLKEETRIRELERAKAEIVKLPYDLLSEQVGPAKNSAKRWYDQAEEWWKQRRYFPEPKYNRD